jgi:hypothetical protein
MNKEMGKENDFNQKLKWTSIDFLPNAPLTTSPSYRFDKVKIPEVIPCEETDNFKITLYSTELDMSVSYYIYHPMKERVSSETDTLTDVTINKIFNELLGSFSLDDILFHVHAGKLKQVTKDEDDENDRYPTGKYVDRYFCSCYNWICDGCLEDESKEIKIAIRHVINQRYVIASLYKTSGTGSIKLVADKVTKLVDKYLTA